MTEGKLKVLHLQLNTSKKTLEILSKEYELSISTLSIWKYMKIEELLLFKFKKCLWCEKTFYQEHKSGTCSHACSVFLRRQAKRRSYEKNKHKINRYDANIRLKLWRIKDKIMKGKEL